MGSGTKCGTLRVSPVQVGHFFFPTTVSINIMALTGGSVIQDSVKTACCHRVKFSCNLMPYSLDYFVRFNINLLTAEHYG